MPQAKLPDINAGFVRYRNYGIQCMEQKNYNGVVTALNGINALLPEEYRVEVNTDKYLESIQEKTLLVCEFCNGEVSLSDIKPIKLFLPYVIRFISNEEHQTVWECIKCHGINKLKDSKRITETHQQPYFNKVVPVMPKRKDGLQTRSKFHVNFTEWFVKFLEELEHQLGLYRKEYVPIDEIEAEEIEGGGENVS